MINFQFFYILIFYFFFHPPPLLKKNYYHPDTIASSYRMLDRLTNKQRRRDKMMTRRRRPKKEDRSWSRWTCGPARILQGKVLKGNVLVILTSSSIADLFFLARLLPPVVMKYIQLLASACNSANDSKLAAILKVSADVGRAPNATAPSSTLYMDDRRGHNHLRFDAGGLRCRVGLKGP